MSLPTTEKTGFSNVRNAIAVASGKGGVGKTTVSVNLAVALAAQGFKVGLLDADIYGPNVPLMMGVTSLPPMQEGMIVPAQAHGVKVMSMGFLIPPGEAVVWRGPMLHGAMTKFVKEVIWGELDFLVMDLPPGTGDVQLSLSQTLPLTGAVIVTTPQEVALQDVRRSISMFAKVKVPILGVIENMSGFDCPQCHTVTPIFNKGGGAKAASEVKVPFLGEISLLPEVRVGSDTGEPVTLAKPDSHAAKAFQEIASKLVAQVSKLTQESGQKKTVWEV